MAHNIKKRGVCVWVGVGGAVTTKDIPISLYVVSLLQACGIISTLYKTDLSEQEVWSHQNITKASIILLFLIDLLHSILRGPMVI